MSVLFEGSDCAYERGEQFHGEQPGYKCAAGSSGVARNWILQREKLPGRRKILQRTSQNR